MRFKVAYNLAAVVLIPASVAIVLSIFALWSARMEERAHGRIATLTDQTAQVYGLVRQLEAIVISADAVIIESDREKSRQNLTELTRRIGVFDHDAKAFFAASQDILSADARTALQLRFIEFTSYQRDTANLGLTISPEAARIQAADDATIENRDAMIRDLDGLGRRLAEKVDVERMQVGASERQSMRLLETLPPLAVVLALLLSFAVVRSRITRPLERLNAA